MKTLIKTFILGLGFSLCFLTGYLTSHRVKAPFPAIVQTPPQASQEAPMVSAASSATAEISEQILPPPEVVTMAENTSPVDNQSAEDDEDPLSVAMRNSLQALKNLR